METFRAPPISIWPKLKLPYDLKTCYAPPPSSIAKTFSAPPPPTLYVGVKLYGVVDPLPTTDTHNHPKGVYPQNNGSLAIAHIDASKGFIDLWVHFFVAIEDNHFDGKGVFWFRLNSNMFNISLAMVIFSNQN